LSFRCMARPKTSEFCISPPGCNFSGATTMKTVGHIAYGRNV
jgi:hypothetical protein